LKNGLKLRLYTGEQNIVERQFLTTGSAEFIDAFQKAFPTIDYSKSKTEDEIFSAASIPYIVPCMRETETIIERAKNNKLPNLIQTEDIRSIIHSHSNWSDGSNTLEEMADECIKRGFEYLVISDHSQSAFMPMD
jgi:DNA polymerase (family 10)